MRLAMQRARPDLLYPHLLRQCIRQGITLKGGKHHAPTLAEVADWIGRHRATVEAWLRPLASKTYRQMNRGSARLVIHEFRLRDHSRYDWLRLLRRCD